jgi:hypothetical protein
MNNGPQLPTSKTSENPDVHLPVGLRTENMQVGQIPCGRERESETDELLRRMARVRRQRYRSLGVRPICRKSRFVTRIRAERIEPRLDTKPRHAVGAALDALTKPFSRGVLVPQTHINGADFVRAEVSVSRLVLQLPDQFLSLCFWPATARTCAAKPGSSDSCRAVQLVADYQWLQ